MSRSYRILAFLSLLIGLFAPLTLLAQWRSISTSMPGIVRTNSYGGNIKYKQGTLCIGMDNQIAVSSDLGATWVRTSLGPTGNTISDIDMYDGNTIVVVTSIGTYLTLTRGQAWTYNLNQLPMTSVRFMGSIDTIAATTDLAVIKSNDAGVTWTTIYGTFPDVVPCLHYGPNNTLYGLNDWPTSNAIGTRIISSNNSGATWNTFFGNIDYDNWSFDLDNCDPRLIVIVNEENYITTDHSACFYISNDGGQSWNRRRPTPDLSYYCGSVSIAPGGAIFAQSAEQGVIRSTDQGITWSAIGGPTGLLDSRTLFAESIDTVFALDDTGAVWMTTNSGGYPGTSPDTNGTKSPIVFSKDSLFTTADISHCDTVYEGLKYSHWPCPSAYITNIALTGASASYQVVKKTVDSLVLEFIPTGPGAQSADMTVSLSNGSSKTIHLRGTGRSTGYQALTSKNTLFETDSLLFCHGDTQAVTLSLHGCQIPAITGWKLSGVDTSDYVLLNSSGDSVSVGFIPQHSGTRNELLIATLSDSTTVSIPLIGFGIDPGPPLIASVKNLFASDSLLTCDTITRSFILTPSPCADRAISSERITGNASSDYSIVSGQPSTLGSSDTITIRFAPSAVGGRTASFELLLSDSTRIAIPLSGAGLDPGIPLTCSVKNLFLSDTVLLCDSITRGFRIGTNICVDKHVKIQSVTGASALSYRLSGAPNILTGDDSVTITFIPTLPGTYNGVYTFMLVGGESFTVALGGTCINAPYTFTADKQSLFSKDTLFSCNADTTTLILSKSGCAIATYASVSISGAAAGDYSIVQKPADSVLSVDSLSVAYNPSASGLRPAMLSLTLTDGKEIDIPLEGVGRGATTVGLAPVAPIATLLLGDGIDIPIAFTGLDTARTMEVQIDFDPTDLVYSGSTATNGTSVDIAGTTTANSSRLHFDHTEVSLTGPSGYAHFELFVDTVKPSIITVSSPNILDAAEPCEYVLDSGFTTTVTGPSGCGITDISDVMRYHQGPHFSIKPNPTSGATELSWDLNVGEFSVEVISVTGERCFSKQFSDDNIGRSTSLDLAVLPSGMYLLRIVTATLSTSIPIVLQR